MRRTHLLSAFLPAVAVIAPLAFAYPPAQTASVTAQLNRYLAGDFEPVVEQLKALESFDGVLDELRLNGPAWVDAAADNDRPRRRLAAATFALEAARAADHVDWKWVQRLKAQNNERQGADHIFWKAPPLLIEWGCSLMRGEPKPPPIERIWHLAAIAVVQRAGDAEFLIGSPFSERMNADAEIDHVYHASGRFKNEGRFKLAVPIAVDSLTWTPRRDRVAPRQADAAARAFENLLDDASVGGEAAMRLGALHARRGRLDDALEMFERAETRTRDRYVIYLARYFKGLALERASRLPDAEASYRGALATIPQAQSATIALAALLAKQGHRAEAAQMIDAQLSTTPAPPDPWLGYGTADDRFWPELIARLRAEIKP